MILFFFTSSVLFAQQYNAHDLSKLKDFMEQSEGEKRNIDLLWADAPATLNNDGSNWVPNLKEIVRWDEDGRLTYIEGKYKNLNGKLDFSGCTALTDVYLRDNNFTELNLEGCTELKMLFVCMNKIGVFNINGCYNIEQLSASSNRYTTFDISNRAKLKRLYIPNNKLTEINVKGCVSLDKLSFTKGSVTSVDLSDCVKLKYLECFGNNISSLDLSNNTQLETLLIYSKSPVGTFTNPLTSLNISGCKNLTSYDFTMFPNLTELNISNCNLLSFDYSRYTNLKTLEAGNQQLTVGLQSVDNGMLEIAVLDQPELTVTPSNNGRFSAGTVVWETLPYGEGLYRYDFTTLLPTGVTGTPFSGIVSVPWQNSLPVANEEVSADLPLIYVQERQLHVYLPSPQSLRIYNMSGQVVKQTKLLSEGIFDLSEGIYIVQLSGGRTQKVAVR